MIYHKLGKYLLHCTQNRAIASTLKYLIKNNFLYSKQFGFQNSHSADHALAQLIDHITESFENNNYTPGVFIDLSNAFVTVDELRSSQKIGFI